ncbi:Bifunctional DNA primase/polymerase [Rhodococcus sp. AW25M09]|uniref:AAA family ATPase n=1 Tax=Rhodococcus sp. AW25M09 TaxID=1268303 RepID=UPI0002AC2947|nr:AAA family ATPase [Rhodococcus sp. AW25M09]CCQ15930.1 Bifunctional DNA primase/polymerase [Rhodococcus sp. AW25M09]
MSGFGDTAHSYKSAGWNVVPIPHGTKRITITGYTGNDGIDASGADLQAWIEDGHDADNIGLRMPETVVGIDIDAYHGGLTTLAVLVQDLGALPSTPRTTARTDGSGISFYRIPVSTLLPSGLGKGIDIVRRGHRYAVAPPSLHPEGTPYRWLDSDGTEVDFPAVESLPMLPQSWVDHLDGLGTAPATITAPDAGPVRLTDGSADTEVARALAEAIEAAQGDSGSRHDAVLGAINRIVRQAERGHPGTEDALAQLRAAYVTAVGPDRSDAGAEFDRMVGGARVKVGQTPSAEHNTIEGRNAADELIEAVRSQGAVAADPVARPRRFVSLGELRSRPRPEPLIEGLLYQNTLAQLYGAPGTFKSFAALGMACAVASGQEQWESHPIHRNGRVLYVAAEGESGLVDRIDAWKQITIDSDASAQLEDNLRVMTDVVSLADTNAMAEVTAEAVDLESVLIILDTRARMTTGLDENSAKDQGVAIEQAEILRKKTGAVLLVIHHSSKAGTSARGSNSWDGAVNTNLMLERVGASMNLKIVCEKHKDAPDKCEHKFVMKKVAMPGDRDSLVMTNGRFDAESLFAEAEDSFDGKDALCAVLQENGTVDGFTRADSWKWYQADRNEAGKPEEIPAAVTTHNRWFLKLITEGKIVKRSTKRNTRDVFDVNP